jgi:hypothetical protein
VRDRIIRRRDHSVVRDPDRRFATKEGRDLRELIMNKTMAIATLGICLAEIPAASAIARAGRAARSTCRSQWRAGYPAAARHARPATRTMVAAPTTPSAPDWAVQYGWVKPPAKPCFSNDDCDRKAYDESGTIGRMGLGADPAHPEGPGNVSN